MHAPIDANGASVIRADDRDVHVLASLHAGVAVHEGEKWIATKWLRERRHD